MFYILEKIFEFYKKHQENLCEFEERKGMNFSELIPLVQDLQVIEQDCEKFSLRVKAKQKPGDLLQKIKALGYAAFLHADAMGIEIVITDRRKTD